MDVAYDSIQKEALVPEEPGQVESDGGVGAEDKSHGQDTQEASQAQAGEKPVGLNAEFQEAFKAVSASLWGAALGGFFGQVRKQGETLYTEAQKEVATRSEQATKGLEGLRSNLAERARGISLPQPIDSNAASLTDPNISVPASPTKAAAALPGQAVAQRAESLSADLVKEATSLVSAFRQQASSRLKDLQRAEDAADEALLKFGTNIRDFFRDAVTITAPDDGSGTKRELLFETNDSEGKRVFHTSRLEAQLHVIHMTPSSFQHDSEGTEWQKWREEFNADNETDRINADLTKFDELRRVHDKLVPQQVDKKAFWRRYYFLRKAVEEEEQRRKEILTGAAADDNEEVGWDDDEEESISTTPIQAVKGHAASQSTTTLIPPKPDESVEKAPRRSNEDDKKSTADSDASYDLVSGATSRTPGSPKEAKKDDSDDEDWE